MKPTAPEQIVEHHLDSIPAGRTVEVSLRDLLYIHQTLGELVSFFHQPDHYPDLQAVQRFLGTRDSGALHVLFEAYYRRSGAMLPTDIREAFDRGDFDHAASRDRA